MIQTDRLLEVAEHVRDASDPDWSRPDYVPNRRAIVRAIEYGEIDVVERELRALLADPDAYLSAGVEIEIREALT